jgi:hypothetical protein
MASNAHKRIHLIVYRNTLEILKIQENRVISFFLPPDRISELPDLIGKNNTSPLYCFDNSDGQMINIEVYPNKINKKDLFFWIFNKRKNFLKNNKTYKGYSLWKNRQMVFVEIGSGSLLYKVLPLLKSKGLRVAKIFSYLLEKGQMLNIISRPLLSSAKAFSLIVAYNEDDSMQHWVFRGEALLFVRSWTENAITPENQDDLVTHAIQATKRFLEKREDCSQLSIIFFCEKENPSLVQKICQIFPRSLFFLPQDIESMAYPLKGFSETEESRLFHRFLMGQKRYVLRLSTGRWQIKYPSIYVPSQVYYICSGVLFGLGLYFIYGAIRIDFENRSNEKEIFLTTKAIKNLDQQLKKMPLTSGEARIVHQSIERSMVQFKNFSDFLKKFSLSLNNHYTLNSLQLNETKCLFSLGPDGKSISSLSRSKEIPLGYSVFEQFLIDFQRYFKNNQMVVLQSPENGKTSELFQGGSDDNAYQKTDLIIECASPLQWS